MSVDQIWPGHVSGLTDQFEKDLLRERRLEGINNLLHPIEQVLQSNFQHPNNPITFIFGAPRSGTTLLSQIINASRMLHIISNFSASFWKSPTIGILIERALNLPNGGEKTYLSKRGRTAEWGEPSEFGYFWSGYFDKGQSAHFLDDELRKTIDRAGLRRAVASMESVCSLPMAFKNNTWFTFHADILAEIFPGCVLVACRRDPFYVAQSILLQRIDLFNDVTRWWSIRPPNYDQIASLPPVEQVAAQAVSIASEMEKSLRRVKNATVIDVPYARLSEQPQEVLKEIAVAAGVAGEAIDRSLENIPGSFETTDKIKIAVETAEELRNAVDKWTAIMS